MRTHGRIFLADRPQRASPARSLAGGDHPVRSGGCRGGRRWWHRDPPLRLNVVSGLAEAELDAALTGLRAGLEGALRADGVLGEPRCTVVRPRASTCARALVAATGAERRLDAGLLRRPPDRRRGGGHRRSRAGRRSYRGRERAHRPTGRAALRPVPCLVDVCGRPQPRDLAAEPLLDDRLAPLATAEPQ